MARTWFTTNEGVANAFGYAIGIIVSYILNGLWTFKTPLKNTRQVLLFILVVMASYLTNLAVVLFSFNVLQLPYQLAHASGILPYTILCFLGCKYLVYKNKSPSIHVK